VSPVLPVGALRLLPASSSGPSGDGPAGDTSQSWLADGDEGTTTKEESAYCGDGAGSAVVGPSDLLDVLRGHPVRQASVPASELPAQEWQAGAEHGGEAADGRDRHGQ
jgi:hypothetical protein